MMRRLFRDKRIVVSGSTLALIVACALFAKWLSPHDPNFQSPNAITLGPSLLHPFGTDSLGRDVFSRILVGSQVSMVVALTTAISGLCLGCFVGGISGMSGGTVDVILMRGLEFFYTLPTLLVLICLNVVFGQGITGILIALSLEGMLTVARLVRGQVMQLKEADFVTAAKALGGSQVTILIKHIFPNLLGPILVTLTFLIPANIMYEAFLSFIGLGIPPPYSSWGTLANEGWRGLLSHPHLIFFPGFAIFITMLAFNFLGDGLRDILDPRGETW